jgi:hygromycin-B 7''-O-kinase
MPKDYYIQPDAPDPLLSAEQVLTYARQHAPDAKAVTGVDETGGEARTYAIDHHLIFKTQRPQQLRPRTSLRKEVFFLQQLEGVAGLNVPRVIGYGHPEPQVEYTMMTRMPGVAFRNAQLTGETRREALKALGRMLRRVHKPRYEKADCSSAINRRLMCAGGWGAYSTMWRK